MPDENDMPFAAEREATARVIDGVKRYAPYPFCCHPEKCIAAGKCKREVKGEPWCCAD